MLLGSLWIRDNAPFVRGEGGGGGGPVCVRKKVEFLTNIEINSEFSGTATLAPLYNLNGGNGFLYVLKK